AFRGRRFNPWRQGEDTFNPFVATLLSKGGGLLPLLVLDMLVKKARYGNEIMEEIGRKTNGQWVANPGAIYPLMSVLEEAGLISGTWADPRKRTVRVYEITEKGRLELPRLKAIVKPKLDEALAVFEVISAELEADDDNPQTTSL
ncbi:MAG TPA: PadR family transcriptional regulator, partial [Anaerolineae bacterium]|nr:PadR family transcriptional regulator [Anaerolineae bacterium]